MPVKFGLVIFARCIARHVLREMLIGGAAARRQLVARGLGNHMAAAARTIAALATRPDAIFSRASINTAIRQQQAGTEILQ